MIHTIDEFVMLCRKAEYLYIYGAGKNAKSVTAYFKEGNISINGYIVSNMEGNPEELCNLPVKAIADFEKDYDQYTKAFIIVSITKNSKVYKEIFETICQYKLHNVFFLPEEFLKIMNDEQNAELENKVLCKLLGDSIYYLNKSISVERYHTILCMKSHEGKEYHWRFKNDLLKKTDINMHTLFPDITALEEFENLYGRYYILRFLETKSSVKGNKYAIYMACAHMDKEISCRFFPQWIIPIQVGTILTNQRIGKMHDNEGDNISDRNGIYSECTALYWMWKHAPRTDYIGLCHYRRHFDMSEEDLARLSGNDIDILVTTPTFVYEGIGNFFSSLTPRTDIEMLLKAINQVQPAYFDTAQTFLQSRFFPPCNLSLMKYDLFQEYAKFVFSITFKIEEFYDNMGFYRKDRYMGYLVECLLGIFLMHNKEQLKIAYTDMVFYS